MAQLNVYDKFGDLIESHKIHGDLLSWIKANCPDYKETIRPPYHARLNGNVWPHKNHGQKLGQHDIIELTIEPKDPATIVLVVIAVLSAAYAYYVASNLPDYQNSSEPGKSIYAPSANANSIVPSGLIREVAGQMTIYPDLICPPHRRYENNDEYLYLMLSVGAGYFSLSDQNIYIAETPIINYEGDISADIYEPGATVSSSEASENWYQSNEVADLKLTTASTPKYGVWTVDILADEITSYLDGFATEFPFIVGEIFQLETPASSGYFRVLSLSGSSDETATVEEMVRAGGDTGRIEAIVQSDGVIGRALRRNFEVEGPPSLTTENDVVVEWSGINGGINWEGPFQIAPQNETARYAEVDILFPQGLTGLDDEGENINHTVDISVQWRERGAATWTTVSSTSYTAQTYDQLGYTIEIDFGSEIEPEFRFRRITNDAEENKIADIVIVRRVKALLETPTSYPDITTIAMRLKGTNALARTAENKINIRGATRKLPLLSEMEAGSFDLSKSVTETSNSYELDGASLLSVAQMTNIGLDPDYDGGLGGISFTSDGSHVLTYDNGAIKINYLTTAYDTREFIYNGYEFSSSGQPSVSARFSGSDYVYYISKIPSPSSNYTIGNQIITKPSGEGEISVVTGSGFALGAETGATAVISMDVNQAGTKFWVADYSDGLVYQYSMSTPHDLATSSYDSVSFDPSTELGAAAIQSIVLTDYSGSDPQKIFVMSSTGIVYRYTMSTAGDLTTASYDSLSFDTGLSTNAREIHVTSNRIFVSTVESDTIFIHTYRLPEVVETRDTRSIARFVGWTLYDALGSDSATMINWDALDTLNTLWESRGDYLDAEFVDETTLWEALKAMLAPGYAEPTIKEGQFLPVRIAAGSDYSHLYTPDIMTGDGLQISHSHYDAQEPDGIDVEYFDLDTNQMEVVECRATGDAGIRPKRLQAIGITDRTKAWRYGMRERNRLRYKPGNLEFSTEMDALNSEYGDAIAVASDIFTSQCGEIVSYSAPEVTLDFEPEFGSGTHYMAFRNRDGEMSGLYTVIATSNRDTVELTSPTSLDFVPVTDGSMDSTFCTFGNASEWGIRAICRRISPQGENNVNVTAEEYLAAVYQDDDNSPPS